MDRIEKALAKLTPKERTWVMQILQRLIVGDTKGLNVKKLKGRDDIFRVRKGNVRIIYRTVKSGIFILTIERRSCAELGQRWRA